MKRSLIAFSNKVYIVRHGQSIWNHDSKFTGWTDIPLTNKGKEEARQIAKILLEKKIYPNIFFSSVLDRAIQSTNIIKKELRENMDLKTTTYTSWRLNEKHYGTLEGVPRKYIRDEYGEKFTKMMRNNFYMKPPVIRSIEVEKQYDIYQNCYYDTMKDGESKENVLNRLLPYFQNDILYTLKNNNIPMIVTHKHCARVLMKYLLNLNDEQFEEYEIPSKNIIELELNEDYTLKNHSYIDYAKHILQ